MYLNTLNVTTQIRWKYTTDELYAAYDLHNGNDIVEENVIDERYGINSRIRLLKQERDWWRTRIDITKSNKTLL